MLRRPKGTTSTPASRKEGGSNFHRSTPFGASDSQGLKIPRKEPTTFEIASFEGLKKQLKAARLSESRT